MTVRTTTADVSVIVPTYNRAEWIARTLERIIAQTLPPAEIIVVDDGSSDHTEAVCATFGSHVRYVRQHNGGVSRARNHGAALASHTWISFCDSDDLWLPQKLEIQLAATLASDTAWSITNACMIGLDDRPIGGGSGFEAIFPAVRDSGVSAKQYFERFLQPDAISVKGRIIDMLVGDAYLALFAGNFVLPSSALIRREAFRASGGFDEGFRLAEETEFFHRFSSSADLTVVMEPLVGYRVAQADSLVSSANIVRLIENALKSLDQAARLRPDPDGSVRQRHMKGRGEQLVRLARAHVGSSEGVRARTALRQAADSGRARDLESVLILLASFVPYRLIRAARRLQGRR